MKVINRTEFLKMPPGTVFAEGKKWIFSDICIKAGNCGANDYGFTSLDAMAIECSGSTELLEFLEDSLTSGRSLPMDFECGQRDGCFNDKALYAILEEDDIRKLITALQGCLPK